MNFDWKSNGFKDQPAPALAKGTEKLYRAWGGHPGRKWGNKDLPGVCFSFDKAISRWEAEELYSVMEYQHPVFYITEFSIEKNTPIWIGIVHPGEPGAVLGNRSGSQVLVERAYLQCVCEGETSTMRNDLGRYFVYSGKLPAIDS